MMLWLLFLGGASALEAPPPFAYPLAPGAVVDPALQLSCGSVSVAFVVQASAGGGKTNIALAPRPSSFARFAVPAATAGGGGLTCALSLASAAAVAAAGRGVAMRVAGDALAPTTVPVDLATDNTTLRFDLRGPAHYLLRLGDSEGDGAGGAAFPWVMLWVDPLEAVLREPPPSTGGRRVIDVAAIAPPSATELRTRALQQLIDGVPNATAGATYETMLYFRAGAYRTEQLALVGKQNLTLYLAPGAVLRGPSAPGGACETFHAWGQGMLQVVGGTGVSVAGAGTVDGNGCGGNLLFAANSSALRVTGVHLCGSREWAVPIINCSAVSLLDAKVFSGKDGLDPDSSTDVLVSGAFVMSMDDAIAVKATVPGVPSARVRVRNSLVCTKKSALKVGTESLAPFEDITFEDVDVFDADRSIVLYAFDGAPMTRLTWRRIHAAPYRGYSALGETKNGRIFDLQLKKRGGLCSLTNITISDVAADAIAPSSLTGAGASWPLTNVTLSNVTLRALQPLRQPHGSLPYLFECKDVRAPGLVTLNGLRVEWGVNRALWGGLQDSAAPPCVQVSSSG